MRPRIICSMSLLSSSSAATKKKKKGLLSILQKKKCYEIRCYIEKMDLLEVLSFWIIIVHLINIKNIHGKRSL